MPNSNTTGSFNLHGDQTFIQDAFNSFLSGLGSGVAVGATSLTFGAVDPDPIAGLIYTPDGYGNVTITIPDFTAATGCTYTLNHSDDGFSTFSTDQNVSPNAAPQLVYQTGRQYRVDIYGSDFTVVGEATSPLP